MPVIHSRGGVQLRLDGSWVGENASVVEAKNEKHIVNHAWQVRIQHGDIFVLQQHYDRQGSDSARMSHAGVKEVALEHCTPRSLEAANDHAILSGTRQLLAVSTTTSGMACQLKHGENESHRQERVRIMCRNYQGDEFCDRLRADNRDACSDPPALAPALRGIITALWH